MSAAPPSTLDTARGPGTWLWLAPSLLFHLGLAATLLLLQGLDFLTDRAPLIDPDDAIEVTLAPMPKSPSALPERAARAAAPQAAPAPAPTEAPPPPKTSDLVVHDEEPDPAPKEAAPEETTRDVSAEMDDLLSELDAPDGPVDRDASSPEGSDEAEPTSVVGAASGNPEVARYVAQISSIFLEEFRPLPALKGKGFSTMVLVRTDDGGRILSREVSSPSGNPAWDRAALAATEAVSSLPLPPASLRDGRTAYRIRFEDP